MYILYEGEEFYTDTNMHKNSGKSINNLTMVFTCFCRSKTDDNILKHEYDLSVTYVHASTFFSWRRCEFFSCSLVHIFVKRRYVDFVW